MNNPTISIVTVALNAARTIGDTIQSVASQKYPHIDHVIVDGCSTDGTLDVLARAPKNVRWVSESDEGIYAAMNKGIALAKGEIVGTLNADDVYVDSSVLSDVASAFEDHEVDACFADLLYVDARSLNKIVRYWRSCPYRPGLFEKGWMPAHPTFFVRRKVYEDHGLFDLNFPRQADFELTMRLLAVHKIRSTYVPRIWVKMRVGGKSNNSIIGILKGNLEAWRACKKNRLDIGPFFVVSKIVSRLPQFLFKPK